MHQMGPALDAAATGPGTLNGASPRAPGPNDAGAHSNLYIKNIPQEVDEQTLQAIFQPFGPIECCRVQRNPRNTTGLTFGFVKFQSVDQALSAIAGLNGATVANSVLEVRLADADPAEKAATGHTPSDNLYVRNLPAHWRDADLRALFAAHGTVADCRILPNQEHHRGLQALVRMACVEEAARAIAALNGTPPGGGAEILLVRYADTAEEKARRKAKHENSQNNRYAPYHAKSLKMARGPAPPTAVANGAYPAAVLPAVPQAVAQAPYCAYPPVGSAQDPAIPPQAPAYPGYPPPPAGHACGAPDPTAAAYYGAAYAAPAPQAPSSVYVKNLPHDADKLFLYEKFAPFGSITSVKAMLDEGGRCKGVGFVNFADGTGALAAVQGLHGQQCGEKALHVSLQTHRGSRGSG